MRCLRRFVGSCLVSAAAVASGAAVSLDRLKSYEPVPASEPIPIVDFFRPPKFAQMQLNPAGTAFATLVSSEDDHLNLAVLDLEKNDVVGLGERGLDIYDSEWLDDRRVLVRVSKDKIWAQGLFVADVGNLRRTVPITRYDGVSVIGIPRANPLRPLIWVRQDSKKDGTDSGVVQVDATKSYDRNRKIEVVRSFPTPKGGFVIAYLADKDGELAFALTGKDGDRTLHTLQDGAWSPSPLDLSKVDLHSVGDRPGEVWVLTAEEAGKPRVLRRADTRTGVVGEVVINDPLHEPSATSLYRRRSDGQILGMGYERDTSSFVWFDPFYSSLQRGLEAALPGTTVRILGSDLAEKTFFILTNSDRLPRRYFEFKRERGELRFIVDLAPWIDPERMLPMQPFSYQARDGKRIDGYLTLPAAAGQKPPLVVLPHGGPWVRDTWRFDPEVQFLASRGYAVFQPNYRGSDGYDWRYEPGDDWEFLKMHQDVTDGVRVLIEQGKVDADRIAIMGWSFGAYLALSGVAYESDLYRCGITLSGVYDWERLMEQNRYQRHARTRYNFYKENLGDPARNRERFQEISPIHAVNRIKVPVYVGHGEQDERTAIEQSSTLVRELRKHGVPHQVRIEGREGHGFATLRNQVELYTEIESFLAENLKPKARASGP